jgi:hypothetical protein
MKQIRASGFLLYRKRRLRRLMLTEEELDWIGIRLEISSKNITSLTCIAS